jgi:hypothetical protein
LDDVITAAIAADARTNAVVAARFEKVLGGSEPLVFEECDELGGSI